MWFVDLTKGVVVPLVDRTHLGDVHWAERSMYDVVEI